MCRFNSLLILSNFIRFIFISIVLCFIVTNMAKADANENKAKPPTTIQASVESTLEISPAFQRKKYIKKAAEWEIRQAKGGYYPSVYFDSHIGAESWSDEWSRKEDSDLDFERNNATSIGLVQNLFTGFETANRVNKANHNYSAADYRVLDTVQSVGRDAVLAFIEVYRQMKLVDISIENVNYHQEIQKLTLTRSEGDQEIAGSRLTDAESTKELDERGLKKAISAFRILTGLEPGKTLEKPDILSKAITAFMQKYETTNEHDKLVRLVDDTIRNNLDLKAINADIDAADSQTKIVKSRFYPKVALELYSSYKDYEDESYKIDNQILCRVGWSLFNGGSDYAAQKAALKAKSAVNSEYEERKNEISTEVSDRFHEYQSAITQIENYKKAVAKYGKTLNGYKSEYKDNKNNRRLSEVLDTKVDLFTNERLRLSEESDKLIAGASILALNGALIKKKNGRYVIK